MINARMNIEFKAFPCMNFKKYNFSIGEKTLLSGEKTYTIDGKHLEYFTVNKSVYVNETKFIADMSQFLDNYKDENDFFRFAEKYGVPFIGSVIDNISGYHDVEIVIINYYVYTLKAIKSILTTSDKELIKWLPNLYKGINEAIKKQDATMPRAKKWSYVIWKPSGGFEINQGQYNKLLFAIQFKVDIVYRINTEYKKYLEDKRYVPKEILSEIRGSVIDSVLNYSSSAKLINHTITIVDGRIINIAITANPWLYYALCLAALPTEKKYRDREYSNQPIQKLKTYFRISHLRNKFTDTQYKSAKNLIDKYEGQKINYEEIKQLIINKISKDEEGV